jgi:hypothetical protein
LLVAYIIRHGPALLDAADAAAVASVLFRHNALQLRPWLRRAYELQEAAPLALLPAWPRFRPLPQGATYSPLAFPHTLVVEHGVVEVGPNPNPNPNHAEENPNPSLKPYPGPGHEQVARIRAEEQQMARQRVALEGLRRHHAQAEAAHGAWLGRAQHGPLADAAQDRALGVHSARRGVLAAETRLQMREEALRLADSLARRRAEARAVREAALAHVAPGARGEAARREVREAEAHGLRADRSLLLAAAGVARDGDELASFVAAEAAEAAAPGIYSSALPSALRGALLSDAPPGMLQPREVAGCSETTWGATAAQGAFDRGHRGAQRAATVGGAPAEGEAPAEARSGRESRSESQQEEAEEAARRRALQLDQLDQLDQARTSAALKARQGGDGGGGGGGGGGDGDGGGDGRTAQPGAGAEVEVELEEVVDGDFAAAMLATAARWGEAALERQSLLAAAERREAQEAQRAQGGAADPYEKRGPGPRGGERVAGTWRAEACEVEQAGARGSSARTTAPPPASTARGQRPAGVWPSPPIGGVQPPQPSAPCAAQYEDDEPEYEREYEAGYRYDTEGYDDVLLPRAAVSADAAARPPLLPQLFGSASDCAGMDTTAQPRAPTELPTRESPGAVHAAIAPGGAARPRGEVEAPAGEKRVYSDTGYYSQAVYTPEQQARLGIDGHGEPAVRVASARARVNLTARHAPSSPSSNK